MWHAGHTPEWAHPKNFLSFVLTLPNLVAITRRPGAVKVSSNSKQTESIRLNKARKQGRDRKKVLENKGTTKSETQLFGNTLAK